VLLRGAVRSSAGQAMPEAVRDVLTSVGWAPEPPSARGAVRERWESLNSLVALADDLHATRGSDLGGLVAELDERMAAQHAPTVAGVTLASLHAAKGLEWDAVFLVGVSEGLLPISLAEGDDAIAEERRLLYVGITRAREHLQLSFGRARTPGGRASRKRSRFLDGIWPEEGSGTRGGLSRRAAARARTEGFTQENPADAELFDRLRGWRGEVAKVISKPAYTVLHDTTLQAIATAKPKDLRQLAVLRGIGATKLDAYGPQVLAVVRGEEVDVQEWLAR
jgi:DNA helicase II / ATP-dependent DNA helicase PcrA